MAKQRQQCKAFVLRGRMGSGRCVNAAAVNGLCRVHAKKVAAGKAVHLTDRKAATVSDW